MEQRRLRLGDILDDYCPRERRVTNHAVVAMVEEDVKQTRCTTCDAEHVYKGGKTPRKKKGETTGTLYKQVLAGLTDEPPSLAAAPHPMSDEPQPDDMPIEVIASVVDDDIPVLDEAPLEDVPEEDDLGPVHRPLIRAQLPRVEGVKLERQAPDFTIRQNSNGRGSNGHFRGAGSNGGGGGSQRFGRGPQRGVNGGNGANGGGRGGANQGFGRGPGGGNAPRHDRGGGPRRRGGR